MSRRLPDWLDAVPLHAILSCLPEGWRVEDSGKFQGLAIRGPGDAFAWLPGPGFADYRNRVAGVLFEVEEVDGDAALVMLWNWRSYRGARETAASSALAEHIRAFWSRGGTEAGAAS